MKTIPLTRGYQAFVDDEDYELVTQHKWTAHINVDGSVYAVRGRNKKCPHAFMHRLIMNAQPGQLVDHRNERTLDNRRSNLRLCKQAENLRNRGKTKANTSGFKGVTFRKSTGRWIAQIKANYQHYYLGVFDTAKKAAKAYDTAALRLHGEFARLNFPRKKIS